jgi:hypothetical protein
MNKRIRLKKKLTGYSFSKKDLWCLDRTLARFCAEGIRQFIKMKRNSYPGDLSPEKWEKVLKDIHWSLDNIANDYIDDPWEQRIRKGIEPRYNRALETEYDERIRRGLKLFDQYFCDLWD